MAASSPATTIGASKKKKKKLTRISDFLHDDDNDSHEAVAPASSPGTPRLRLPGFTCARIRFGRIKRRGGRKSEAASSSPPPPPADDATSGRDASSLSAGATAAGLGLSLLFLLARTSVELSKMAEVRAQMEALLGEMRDEAAAATCKLHTAAARRDLKLTSSSSTSSSLGSGYSMATGSGETTEEKPLHEQEEEEWSSDGEFIELVEGGFGAGAGEGIGEGGVSGVELERRLREVKQERERERVTELEAALRRARWRLLEKEMEARLWKDTAELALQQRPPIAGNRQ